MLFWNIILSLVIVPFLYVFKATCAELKRADPVEPDTGNLRNQG